MSCGKVHWNGKHLKAFALPEPVLVVLVCHAVYVTTCFQIVVFDLFQVIFQFCSVEAEARVCFGEASEHSALTLNDRLQGKTKYSESGLADSQIMLSFHDENFAWRKLVEIVEDGKEIYHSYSFDPRLSFHFHCNFLLPAEIS